MKDQHQNIDKNLNLMIKDSNATKATIRPIALHPRRLFLLTFQGRFPHLFGLGPTTPSFRKDEASRFLSILPEGLMQTINATLK